jgi:hypothetical protein
VGKVVSSPAPTITMYATASPLPVVADIRDNREKPAAMRPDPTNARNL